MKQIIFYIILSFACNASLAFCETPDCKPLPVRDCFTTKGCVLDCGNNNKPHCAPYNCRAAQGKCESTFSQKELDKNKCEGMQGCLYSAAMCFCPGPMECYCGGGPPAMCQQLH